MKIRVYYFLILIFFIPSLFSCGKRPSSFLQDKEKEASLDTSTVNSSEVSSLTQPPQVLPYRLKYKIGNQSIDEVQDLVSVGGGVFSNPIPLTLSSESDLIELEFSEFPKSGILEIMEQDAFSPEKTPQLILYYRSQDHLVLQLRNFFENLLGEGVKKIKLRFPLEGKPALVVELKVRKKPNLKMSIVENPLILHQLRVNDQRRLPHGILRPLYFIEVENETPELITVHFDKKETISQFFFEKYGQSVGVQSCSTDFQSLNERILGDAFLLPINPFLESLFYNFYNQSGEENFSFSVLGRDKIYLGLFIPTSFHVELMGKDATSLPSTIEKIHAEKCEKFCNDSHSYTRPVLKSSRDGYTELKVGLLKPLKFKYQFTEEIQRREFWNSDPEINNKLLTYKVSQNQGRVEYPFPKTTLEKERGCMEDLCDRGLKMCIK